MKPKTGKERVEEQREVARKRRVGMLAMSRAGSSPKEIGETFGVTRQRVEVLIAQAIKEEGVDNNAA